MVLTGFPKDRTKTDVLTDGGTEGSPRIFINRRGPRSTVKMDFKSELPHHEVGATHKICLRGEGC